MNKSINFRFCKKIKLFFKKDLTKGSKCGIISRYEKTVYVPLAQLDRVFGYEPKGRGFESLKARQTKSGYPFGYPLFVSRSFITQNPANFRTRKFVITCALYLWFTTAFDARLGSESLNLPASRISFVRCAFLFPLILKNIDNTPQFCYNKSRTNGKGICNEKAFDYRI